LKGEAVEAERASFVHPDEGVGGELRAAVGSHSEYMKCVHRGEADPHAACPRRPNPRRRGRPGGMGGRGCGVGRRGRK
jgi:hypothetical protein